MWTWEPVKQHDMVEVPWTKASAWLLSCAALPAGISEAVVPSACLLSHQARPRSVTSLSAELPEGLSRHAICSCVLSKAAK